MQKKRVTELRRQQRQLKEAYEYPKGDVEMFRVTAMAEDHKKEISWTKKQPISARGKKIGEMWRNLSDDEKKEYEKREKTARSKYRREVEAWEKKMINKGLESVVKKIKLHPKKELNAVGGRRRVKKVLASKVSIRKKRATTGVRRTKKAKKSEAREE